MPHPDKQAALADAAWVVKCFEDAGIQDQPSSQYNMAKFLLAQAAELERLRERMAYAAGKPYQECIHVLRAALKKAE